MIQIPLNRRTAHIYFPSTTTVTLEASWDVIRELDLNTLAGEQYDQLGHVLSIDITPTTVALETTRSLEAWKRGEAGAGRGTHTFKREQLDGLFVADGTTYQIR